MMVYLVVYDSDSFKYSKELFKRIYDHIRTSVVVKEKNRNIYGSMVMSTMLGQREVETSYSHSSLLNRLDNLDEGFSSTLLLLIECTGEKDSYIYKNANIDRKLFSKIRNNPNYHPSMNTAIALELRIDETNDFLGKAEYILSPSIEFDVIVEYCIRNGVYDIFEVNNVLFDLDQDLLGVSMI